METHSSVLAWRIPGTGEPGGLPSMRSHRVGHNWSDLAAAAEEEPEIKLPTSIASSKKQDSSRKNIYFCSIDYTKSFDCVDQNKLRKILQGMGIPDHLTCPLRNLYAVQEATFRAGRGKTDWFQIGKEYVKAVYCHPAYLTSMQSTSWETLDWMKQKLESRLLGEISITSDMQITPGTKEPLDEGERGEWKSWLKIQHSKN